MAMKYMLVSLVGGILGLDRVVLQLMVSRPIVVAPLIGFLLGDAYTGLVVGAMLELFWIDRLPIGTCVPPNDFFVALLVASSSILAGQALGHNSQEVVTFSLLLFLPFGYLGRKLDTMIFASNDALAEGALNDAKMGNIGGICRKHMTGLAKVFFSYIAFILLSLLAGVTLIVHAFPLLPPFLVKALAIIFLVIPVLGVAAGLNTINLKKAIPLFCVLFLALSLILEVVHLF